MGSDTSDLHGAVDDIDEEQNVVCHQSRIVQLIGRCHLTCCEAAE
jgi:hypothetical protein